VAHASPAGRLLSLCCSRGCLVGPARVASIPDRVDWARRSTTSTALVGCHYPNWPFPCRRSRQCGPVPQLWVRRSLLGGILPQSPAQIRDLPPPQLTSYGVRLSTSSNSKIPIRPAYPRLSRNLIIPTFSSWNRAYSARSLLLAPARSRSLRGTPSTGRGFGQRALGLSKQGLRNLRHELNPYEPARCSPRT